jgi:hypothetical protein
MRVNGEWRTRDDNEKRPIIPAMVQLADGTWAKTDFLLDAGADRTVISAQLFNYLRPLEMPGSAAVGLSGIGGGAEAILVQTVIAFKRDDLGEVRVRGPFWVFTEIESSDISILGRDVTNNFAVIYDYQNQVVAFLSRPHYYDIKTGN